MFFDTLCRFVEQHQPGQVPLVQSAALFHFPIVPHEVLPAGFLTDPQKVELYDNFFLPFRCVAVEDRASCVLLCDTLNEQRGWNQERLFIDVRPILGDMQAYNDSPEILQEDAKRLASLAKELPLEDLFVISYGSLTGIRRHERVGNPHGLAVTGAVSRIFLFRCDGIKQVAVDREMVEGMLRAAKVAVEELVLMNTPSRFVVEETLRKPKDRKADRVQRSHERSRYILLEPGAIRNLFKLPATESGTKKLPHERRRHERYFRDDCFTHLKGHKIIVKACWVGPEEAVVGNRRYKVRLDL